MKTHKKIIYFGFGGFAIVKAAIFFFGIIAGVVGIGNVFADSDCSTLTSENLNCCKVYALGKIIDCSYDNNHHKISNVDSHTFDDYRNIINELNFSGNNLQNIDFITQITENYDREPIKILNFSNNKITNITPILDLHYLQEIYFGGNNIQDISKIINNNSLSTLKIIDLSNNRIKQYPTTLTNFQILERLNLNNNHISNLPRFPNSLEYLSLSNNGITGFSILSSLGGPIHLDLSNNDISDITQIPREYLGYSNLSNNCIDTVLNSDVIEYLHDEYDLNIGPQHICSDWTGQNVILNINNLDEYINFEINDETCNTEVLYICTGDNIDICDSENYNFSGSSYEVSCNSGEICQNEISIFFLNDESVQCMMGKASIWIDKVPPTCTIEQGGQKTGDDNIVYRPTNQDVQLTVNATDERGVGKIDHEGYNRGESRGSNSSYSASGNGVYNVMVRDGVGNETGCSISVSNIDREKPEPATGNPSACFSENINVSFQETQHESGEGFGGSYIVYSTGNLDLDCNGNRWDNSLTFTEDTDLTVGVCDEAGNITTGEYTYALDRAPITNISGYNWQWTGNNLSLSFEIDDGHKLCKKSGESETHYCTYLSGTQGCTRTTGQTLSVNCGYGQVCQTFVKYYSVNASGMSEPIKTGLILIDKEVPSCNITQNPSSGTYTSDSVVLTANASDGNGSNNIKYNWSGTFGIITQYTVSSTGKYSLSVKDLVGNESNCDIDITNIDKDNPEISFSPTSGNDSKKTRTVSIIATDTLAGFQGNQSLKYYRSDVQSCNNDISLYHNGNFESYILGDKSISGSITKSDGDGYKYLCIWGGISDRAGNISQIASAGPYLFDNTGPTGSIQISYNGKNDYASGYTLSLILTGSDLHSDVSGMQFSCDNINWTMQETFLQNKIFNLSAYRDYGCNTGEGVKTIYVKYIDSLGNVGDAVSGSIILDTTAPTCAIEQASCTSGNLRLTLNANEDIETPSERTRISDIEFTKDVTNNDTVTVNINDLAGNPGTCETGITNYDISGPTVLFTDISTNECTAVTWRANAEDVGCAGITVNTAYKFSATNFGDGNWGGATLNITSGQVPQGGTTKIQELIVRDNLGNENALSAVLTINNSDPTITINTGNAGLITGEKVYGNVVSLLNVRDGECGTETITASLVGECTNATGMIANNILEIIPNQNYEGSGVCTVSFTDDEGSTVTGYVIYEIDTKAPDKANCTANACFKGTKQVSCISHENSEGNKVVYTTDDTELSCNSTVWTDQSFVESATLKVAVCDNVQNMSEISTYEYILDNQKPITTLSGLPSGWTLQNINANVDVYDNCGIVDTYYCISDKDEGQCTNYEKIESNNIEVSCEDGTICEKNLRYYSKDDAGNQEEPQKQFIQIDKKPLTCEITFNPQCTNSGIILTLTASKELSNTLFGWSLTGNEDEYTYTKTIIWNEDIDVTVFDHINNSYTCTASVHNFDDSDPIITSSDLYTGDECSTITISPDIIDGGCSSNELQYFWDSNIGSGTYTLDWNNDNSLDIHSTQFTVMDSVGNSTTRTIKYQWIDIPISGTNISVYNVGNGTGIKWTDYVSAGECEEITGVLITSGTIGNCELHGEYIEYSPNDGSVGNDVCQLKVSDGDSDIDIYIMRYGIDNLMPTVTSFTGGFGNVCTNQDTVDIVLSFNKPVTGVVAGSITGENFEIITFEEHEGYQYSWNISLSGRGTGKVWLDTGGLSDMAGNSLVGDIDTLILGNYDNIGPSVPELSNNSSSSDISTITLSREPSTTTGCADLDKYEVMICDDESMENGCKSYESDVNEKTVVKGSGTYYRYVVAFDTNWNRSAHSTVGTFVITSENPTCIVEIQENSMCTSGAVELKLTANKSVSFINSGGIDWMEGNDNTWTGYVYGNDEINGIIIKDGDERTGTCDELIVSSFDETSPSTNLSGLSYLSGGIYWVDTDTHIDLIATDTGCGNDNITTHYCISETDSCVPDIEGSGILLTGTAGRITDKYINYYSIDKAGNREEIKSGYIKIDNQAPQCTITPSTTSITNSSVIITLSGDDGEGIGLHQLPYLWSGNTVWSNQSNLIVWNTGTYTGYVRDILGNIDGCDITIDNIDTMAPDGAGCTASPCFSESINVNCDETTPENGNYIVYSTDGTMPSCGGISGDYFTFTGDTILKVAVCDSAGNISEISTYTYILDNESPYTIVEGLPGGNGRTGSDVQISLSSIDYGCAGGVNTYFRVFDSGADEGTFVSGNDVSIECNAGEVCIKYIEFYSADILGNTGQSMSGIVKIDKQGPLCEIEDISSNGGYTSGSVKLKIDGNDLSGAGIGGSYRSSNLWSNNILSVNTTGTYSGVIYDLVGNSTECSKTVDNIDNIPPSGAVCTNDDACYSGNISISCHENENESGNYIVYTLDNTDPNCNSTSGQNFNITGNTVLKVAVCDKAKNMSDISKYTYNLDNQAPTTTIHGVTDDWVGTDVSIDFSTNDSGCANGLKTYYCIDTGNSCNPNISGNHTTVSCGNGDVCQKYIRYYSKDSVGNKESTKYALVKINNSVLSCSMSYDRDTCTNSGILVHLNISEPISSISGWNKIDGKNYQKIVNRNGTISVTVHGALGGTYTCTTNISTYDSTAPTLDVNDEYIAYKCEDINIIASGHDSGCTGNLTYKWDNKTGNDIKTITWDSGYQLNQDYTITVSLTDNAGNTFDKSIKYKWIGTGLTLNTGTINLGTIGSGDTGYMISISGLVSQFGVNEGICGSRNIFVSSGVCDNATFAITGEYINIGYTNDGGVSCNIIFSNGEGKNITGKILFGGTRINEYCLSGWDNDRFMDDSFRISYSGDNEIGHNQIICALYGYSGDYDTAYTLGRSGYDKDICTGIHVIETGILPSTMESNTIYVLNTGKIIVHQKISMENCSALISKNNTKIYSDKEFEEGHESSMIHTKGYSILENIDIDGINNGTGGHHNRNYHGIDVSSNNTLNNIKSYHNGHGIVIAGTHININNAQTFGNDGAGIWEISNLYNTNTYNTYNNIQCYNNKDEGFHLKGINTKLNNTVSYNNGYDSGSTSRNYITNPKDSNGNYLIKWNNSGLDNAKGLKTIGEVVGYSYGIGIGTQKQPIVYKGSDLVSGGSYNADMFIGSNITKATGTTDIGYSGTNEKLSFKGTSSSTGINKYSLFIIGDRDNGTKLEGITLGDTKQITNNSYHKVVTQLLGTGYFATHYEKNILVDNTQKKYNRFIPDSSKYNWAFSEEMNEAYQYSYEYRITTMPSIVTADMYGNLTRIAMAKMISNYAINILGKTPDTNKYKVFSDISDTLDYNYDYGVQKAYQLGIMGQNMPNNEFRPYDLVTRAEFATALSRLLFNMEDGEKIYYEPHLYILNKFGIISNTNPDLQEQRGYVMLMLLRYHQHNSY